MSETKSTKSSATKKTKKDPVSVAKPTDVLINFVLDHSGSMGPLAASTIEGFNTFIDEQKKTEGKALLSLTLFDTRFDVRYVAADLREVPALGSRENRYNPSGGTALYDAVATTIKGAQAWLSGHPEFDGDVIVAIQTDGEENRSSIYTLAMVNDLISEKTAEGWEFVFFGTGQAAWTEGQKFHSIPESARFSAMASPMATNATYSAASRGMSLKRMTGQSYESSLRAEGMPDVNGPDVNG